MKSDDEVAASGPTPNRKTQNKEDRNGCFFAIDHRCWARACNIGVNAAAAYLVLARGTGRDQSTTSWSVSALEKYTGISRSRARIAIRTLQNAGLISQIQAGTRPRYELIPWATVIECEANFTKSQKMTLRMLRLRATTDGQLKGDLADQSMGNLLLRKGILERGGDGTFRFADSRWIWLPNEFVSGAAEETPPLELLRQSQDVMALQLAVDLYRSQNLREDGGISRETTMQKYERFEVGQQAQFIVWGFQRGNQVVRWNDVTEPHLRDEKQLSDEEKRSGMGAGVDFFSRMELIADLGLIEWVPYLCESDDNDAEIIHPLWMENGDPGSLENRIGSAALLAGLSLLTDKQENWARLQDQILVPVPRHLINAQVIGIARLRYRPKTRMTAAWWAELNTKGEEYVRRYLDMVALTQGAAASERLATSR